MNFVGYTFAANHNIASSATATVLQRKFWCLKGKFVVFLYKFIKQYHPINALGCDFPLRAWSSKKTLTHDCVLIANFLACCIGQFENEVLSHHKTTRPLRKKLF